MHSRFDYIYSDRLRSLPLIKGKHCKEIFITKNNEILIETSSSVILLSRSQVFKLLKELLYHFFVNIK